MVGGVAQEATVQNYVHSLGWPGHNPEAYRLSVSLYNSYFQNKKTLTILKRKPATFRNRFAGRTYGSKTILHPSQLADNDGKSDPVGFEEERCTLIAYKHHGEKVA